MARRRVPYHYELIEDLRGEKVVRDRADANDRDEIASMMYLLQEMRACGFKVEMRLLPDEGAK